MDRHRSNRREGTQNASSSLDERTTAAAAAKAQESPAEAKLQESRHSEDSQQQRKIDGWGKFKVDVTDMLSLRDVLTLATYLSFAKAVVDRMERSTTPGLDMISELESRGEISREDITGLVEALSQCRLRGIASKVEYSYQTNVSSRLGSPPLTRKGKKDLFISQLKRRYKILYDAVQPLPYVKDRMCCVDKVFIQGNIQRRFINKRGDETWQSVESYHDILAQAMNESTRCIIVGDPGYGKSTLSLQFLYDWCNQVQQSPLKDVDIVIFLRMRQLGGLTSIYQAIKQLLLPKDSSLTVGDIKTILQTTKSTVIFFDGYDEYPDKGNENTDFADILMMNQLLDTHVIVTARSADLRQAPDEVKTQSTQFQLTGFTEEGQDEYILKAVVAGNSEADLRRVRDKLNENPVLDAVCQIPLFFTIVAHAAHDKKNKIPTFKSVTWFFRFTLECLFKHTSNKHANIDVTVATARDELSKIAFEGLRKDNQQLGWNKQLFVETLGENSYNTLLRTGILTEDESIYVADRADMTDFFQQLTTTSFYHKLICEWYAAFYLVDLIRSMMGNANGSSASNVLASAMWKDTTDLLSSLDRKDLQYLFRFACGLDPKAGFVIINYLVKQTNYDNLAILCILEFTGKEEDIADAVKALCSKVLKFREDHSKILQRVKVRLLEIASICDIPITELQLIGLFSKVDNNTITLSSGIVLPSLSSLELLLVNARPIKPELTEDEFAGFINYVIKSRKCKTIWFNNFALPPSIRPGLIPDEAKSRNILVLWPSNASQFDLKSGQWKKIDDIQTISQLCSHGVIIRNEDSVSGQRSAIELLVKATNHDIPINMVTLGESFKEVDKTGNIILHSGLSLPILTTVKIFVVQTEPGAEMNEQEVIGILNYAQHSKRLDEVQFVDCLLPQSIHLVPSLSTLQSSNVTVIWMPYGVAERYYRLHLQNEYWCLHAGNFAIFPMKRLGDVLTVSDYNVEKEIFRSWYRYYRLYLQNEYWSLHAGNFAIFPKEFFRSCYRDFPWQQRWVVSRERGELPVDDQADEDVKDAV